MTGFQGFPDVGEIMEQAQNMARKTKTPWAVKSFDNTTDLEHFLIKKAPIELQMTVFENKILVIFRN